MPCLSALLGISSRFSVFLLGPDAVEPTDIFSEFENFLDFLEIQKKRHFRQKNFCLPSVEKVCDYIILPYLKGSRSYITV